MQRTDTSQFPQQAPPPGLTGCPPCPSHVASCVQNYDLINHELRSRFFSVWLDRLTGPFLQQLRTDSGRDGQTRTAPQSGSSPPCTEPVSQSDWKMAQGRFVVNVLTCRLAAGR